MTLAPSTDDSSLLHRYSSTRDPEAFAELARRYAGMVLATAQRITRSDHDAEDIAQSAFLELAKSAAAVRSVPGFLHRAATTRSLNLLRDNQTRRAHEAKTQALLKSPDLTIQELLPIVDVAIDKLPDDLRIPLILHFQQSLSQSDIAATLKLSQPTVSRRLESAIIQLRLLLPKMGEGAMAGVAIGGLSASITTAVLTHTSALTPPVALLSAVNKIGLAGITKSVGAVSSAYLAKLIALLFITTSVALALIYFNMPHTAVPAIISTAPIAATYTSPTFTPDPPESPPESPPVAATLPQSPPAITALSPIINWTSLSSTTTTAFSPDGLLSLSASNPDIQTTPPQTDIPASLILSSAFTMEQFQLFKGHTRPISAVAYSPSADFVASASQDGTLRIWEVLTGDELHRLKIKPAPYAALTFSPDSQKILAGMYDPTASATLTYWDIATEKTLLTISPAQHSPITTLAISPDGRFAAVATLGPQLALFDLTTAKQILLIPDSQLLTAFAFSPNSKQLLTLSLNATISYWPLP